MGKDSERISIIDQGVEIDGTLSVKGVLVVRGTVKGYLDGEKVVVARQGAIYAEMRVTHLTLNGIFDGNLWVSGDLNILAKGKCSGKVACQNLVVEAGGVLNADVAYGRSKGPGTVVDTKPRLMDQVVNLGSLSTPRPLGDAAEIDGQD